MAECYRLSDYHVLSEHDGHGVVQDALTEHQHVQDWIHIQSVENGDSGDGINCRDQRTKCKTAEREGGGGQR